MGTAIDLARIINSKYDYNPAMTGDTLQELRLRRLSTGSYSLDRCLGGGIPFGRITQAVGWESTGKSTIGHRLLKEVRNYDKRTHLHKDFVPEDEFEPCFGVLFDIEGRFDVDWAKRAHGFTDDHMVISSARAEDIADMGRECLMNGADLMIVDSLAMLVPEMEMTNDADKNAIGRRAQIINKCFNLWQAVLNDQINDGKPRTAIFMVNQFREKIGVFMGDNRTIPGGHAQKFATTIRIDTLKQKFETTKQKDDKNSVITFKGKCVKNSTAPLMEYAFDMNVKDVSTGPAGTIINDKVLLDQGLAYDIIERGKNIYKFGGLEGKTQKHLMDAIKDDETVYRQLWRELLEAEVGYIDGFEAEETLARRDEENSEAD